jgi:hypothetical protein
LETEHRFSFFGELLMKQNRVWLFVIGAIAVLSLASLILIHFLKQTGDKVEIYQDGALIHSLPLNQDKTIRIPSENGGYNVVTIKQGEVWVSEASCPDQVCVRHGPTCETKDPIVCLPNKLVVQVTHTDREPLDGVTQ